VTKAQQRPGNTETTRALEIIGGVLTLACIPVYYLTLDDRGQWGWVPTALIMVGLVIIIVAAAMRYANRRRARRERNF
jgi:Na+/melibiose symporter-like transporter